MKDSEIKIARLLLIGIGNNGRGDDGLGWKFLDLFREVSRDQIDLEYRYQLQVEDAELISHYETVIFIDASHQQLQDGFEVKQCKAGNHYYFSSHLQSPEAILYLSRVIFNKSPKAHTLAISGVNWELTTSISETAESNLHCAMQYFEHAILPTIVSSNKEHNMGNKSQIDSIVP